MLSIGKLAPGQESYYLGAVAHGAEDYYIGGAEVPGYWTGRGAEGLGLDGPVTDDDFVALLGGRSRRDGSPLGRSNRRVPALDLTFSAPKSVSVAWALGGSEIGGQVVAAHEEALAAALGYLEREAVFVRRGHNGTDSLEGGGLVGAAFRHRSSRAGDPQLHTHVVVANATQGSDGPWSALDARHLYAHARTAGFLYQAELRAGLSARWGVCWGPVLKGTAELDAVPTAVLREFSQRRAEIEAAVAPGASASAARRATVRTRGAKKHSVEPSTLFVDWAFRAVALGFDLADVEALCRPAPRPHDPARASALELSAELTEHDSSFDRRQVLQALAARAETGEHVEALEAHADAFLAGTAGRTTRSRTVRSPLHDPGAPRHRRGSPATRARSARRGRGQRRRCVRGPVRASDSSRTSKPAWCAPSRPTGAGSASSSVRPARARPSRSRLPTPHGPVRATA